MEAVVMCSVVSISWLLASKLVVTNSICHDFFANIITFKIVKKSDWSLPISLTIVFLVLSLMVLVIEALIFQSNTILIILLHVSAILFTFNLSEIFVTSTEDDDLLTAHILSVFSARIFGFAFWYVALPGLYGGLLFFIIDGVRASVIRSGNLSTLKQIKPVMVVYFIMMWVPARLLAATYALVGDFETATRCWSSQANQSGRGFSSLLIATGAGALTTEVGGKWSADRAIGYTPLYGSNGNLVSKDISTRASALFLRALGFWLMLVLVFRLLL